MTAVASDRWPAFAGFTLCAIVGVLAGHAPIQAVAAAAAVGAFAIWNRASRSTPFDTAVSLMLVALPLYSALVIEVGVTVRLSYVFGLVALLVGLFERRVTLSRMLASQQAWLIVFLAVVFLSVVVNPVSPAVPALEASGWRGIPGLRPALQCVQLLLMVGVFFTVTAYCRTRSHLAMAVTLVAIGGLFAVAYAMYAFITQYARVPFVDINNAMNTDFSFGYKPQNNSYVGGTIPRPRSTFPEPQNFGNFLLLAVPLFWLQMRTRVARAVRAGWGIAFALSVLLFVFAVNSRGAIFGALTGICLMPVVMNARDLRIALPRAVVSVTALTIVAAALVRTLYVEGLLAFVKYMGSRLVSALESSNRVNSDWRTVWHVAREHPAAGVGFGNFTYYIGQVESTALKGVTDAGGLYQRLLVETGFVGLLAYVGFVVSLLWGLAQVARSGSDPFLRTCARLLFFVITADAVQRISTVGIATDAYLWVTFGLAMAVSQLAARRPASMAAA
jgi:hypothetical protein